MSKNSKTITFLLATIPFWVMFFFYNYPIVVIGVFLLFLSILWALWYFKKVKVYDINQLLIIFFEFVLIYQTIWNNLNRFLYYQKIFPFYLSFILLMILVYVFIWFRYPYKSVPFTGKQLFIVLAWFATVFGLSTFYTLNYRENWDFSYPFLAIAILPIMYPLEEVLKVDS